MCMHVLYGAAEARKERLRSFRDDDDDETSQNHKRTTVCSPATSNTVMILLELTKCS